ncbi:MAG: trimethylamine methyltransferase family protein, partial [Desulfobacterales bacterium]
MKNKGIIRPSIRILSNDQKDRIHSDALKILSSIGIRVESSRGREIFKKAIGSNAITDKIVRIPPEIIETALKSAPSKLDIYNREGQKCIHLPGKARFGLGVTTLYFQDPETDDLTPFNRKSLETCVRLGDTLASYDFVSTPGILQDLPPHTVDCYTTL